MYDTAYLIRALVFLAALGIRWPKLDKTVKNHMPFGGMTTIGCETIVEENPPYRRLTRHITKMARVYRNSLL
ncbi:hypothetical protein BDF19DRAFT_430545, partial [Syncephalis fuscata]